MGFGFNLFFVFVLIPLICILLITWFITKNKIYAKAISFIIIGIVIIMLLSSIVRIFTKKMIIKRNDYYGDYIIDRSFFSGKQSDWQYNTFRFTIKKNDSIYFNITDKYKIIKTYKGKIDTNEIYESKRLIIKMEEPNHHILIENPTTYRQVWNFYLVFNSKKFNNVFFKKGNWKPLKD